jgi:antitoxin VapB
MRKPKQVRVEPSGARFRRQEKASVLDPVPEAWAWLDAIAGPLDKDFVEAVNERPQSAEWSDL